jgi:polygalacturonase
VSVVLTVGPPTGVAATDTAAIQSQLDAAETAGGGDVLLSPGTYVHNGLDLGTKVRLRGQGRATSAVPPSARRTSRR